MTKRPRCACGAALNADRRCTADPSCSDFRKPHQRQLDQQRAAERRERVSNRGLGLYRGRSTSAGGTRR